MAEAIVVDVCVKEKGIRCREGRSWRVQEPDLLLFFFFLKQFILEGNGGQKEATNPFWDQYPMT